ncbi:MAG: RagB/SusD family nutrient uptake outer membrane protein [Bacteroidales bacterium]
MKNKIFISLAIIACCFTSCDDDGFLDSYPHGSMTNETFWKSENDALGTLVDCYMSTFNAGQPDEEVRSDNSVQWYDWYNASRAIADGTVTPFADVASNLWKGSYTTIRKCNFFLENVDKVPFETSGLKERMVAEVRFMRAHVYLYAAFDFGNIPLVLKTLSVDESKEVLPSTQQELYAFVITELNESAKVLSADYPSSEFGRISKGACLALKARTYLFQNDYQNVLKAVNELDALGKYALNTAGETPYSDLFCGSNQRNAEIILSVLRSEQSGKLSAGHSTNAGALLKGIAEEDPYTTFFPSGSLVDAYPMADGRLIHEAGSTYDAKNPNKDRDPRLKESVICPGDKMGRLVNNEIVWDLNYDPEDENGYATFKYSFQYPSQTGYAWRKCVDWSAWGFRNVWNCSNDMPLIRYADVLLMKAEALAEINGAGAKNEICALINQLRDRCKGGHVHHENYNSKDDLIRLVRNERRVELANEGLRYYDIIRWRIAEQDPTKTGSGLNGDFYGAYMRLDGVGKKDKTILIDGAPRRYVEKRIFEANKRYLLPIPQVELDFNPNLKQNPNW